MRFMNFTLELEVTEKLPKLVSTISLRRTSWLIVAKNYCTTVMKWVLSLQQFQTQTGIIKVSSKLMDIGIENYLLLL